MPLVMNIQKTNCGSQELNQHNSWQKIEFFFVRIFCLRQATGHPMAGLLLAFSGSCGATSDGLSYKIV